VSASWAQLLTVHVINTEQELLSRQGHGLRIGRPGVRFQAKQVIFFSSPQRPDRHWGPIQHFAKLLSGNFSGSEADLSTPTSAEVNNGGDTSTPHSFPWRSN
jgi:hypothetical protein